MPTKTKTKPVPHQPAAPRILIPHNHIQGGVNPQTAEAVSALARAANANADAIAKAAEALTKIGEGTGLSLSHCGN